jgi:hypothetical protein
LSNTNTHIPYYQQLSPISPRLFLGRSVVIDSFGYVIKAKLVGVQDSDKYNGHRPNVLVLEGKNGRKIIARAWNVIKLA